MKLYASIVALMMLTASARAQSIPPSDSRAYLCSEFFAVTYVKSPNWKTENGGYEGQSVLLNFKSQAISSVTWFKKNTPYYSAKGIGVPMNSGFNISVLGQSFVETYVFNAGNLQLLYSKIRSGDDRFPNSFHTAIAPCTPAGHLVR